jgi:hypothetical protein
MGSDRLYHELRKMDREKIYHEESSGASEECEEYEECVELSHLGHISSQEKDISSDIFSIDEIGVSIYLYGHGIVRIQMK